MLASGRSVPGRHGIGAVVAVITVVVAIVFDLGVTYDNGPSQLVLVVTPLLVGVGAFFSTRWTLLALAASVGVHWWAAEKAIRGEGSAVDPLAGLMYAYPIVMGVLGLVALAMGASVGWNHRRRQRERETPTASSP
jgi:hypothetical protein